MPKLSETACSNIKFKNSISKYKSVTNNSISKLKAVLIFYKVHHCKEIKMFLLQILFNI